MASGLEDLSDIRAMLDQHAALRLTPLLASPAAHAAAATHSALAAALRSSSPGASSTAAAGARGSPPTARELSFAAALHATKARLHAPVRTLSSQFAPKARRVHAGFERVCARLTRSATPRAG